MKTIKACIFDLDGTVLNDEKEYALSFRTVLKELGVPSPDEFPHKAGVGMHENWKYLTEKYSINTTKSVEELVTETQDIFLKQLIDIKVKEGFTQFVDNLKRMGVATALATSNQKRVVDEILTKFDLEKYFDVVVTLDDVTKVKPDPEIFMKVAQQLQVEPNEAIVFEDSQVGIEAAKKIGMTIVAVTKDKTYAQTLSHADHIIYNFVNALESLEHYFDASLLKPTPTS